MSTAIVPQLSLSAYATALYRFMACAARAWGGVNAQYGEMVASGVPATLVNELCPFDAVGLSRELVGRLIAPADLTKASRRRWIKNMRRLAAATKGLRQYLNGAPLGVLIERDGMFRALHFDEVLSKWDGMEKASLRCVREVARALALVTAVCDVLITSPEVFLVTDWVDPFTGPQGETAAPVLSNPMWDEILLAGFDAALAAFVEAAEPVLGGVPR